MEHWLPLFEEKLATLFDHLGRRGRSSAMPASPAAAEQRFEAIADYCENRNRAEAAQPGSYRPLPAGRAVPRRRRVRRRRRRRARAPDHALPRARKRHGARLRRRRPARFRARARQRRQHLRGGRRAPRQAAQGRPQAGARQLFGRRARAAGGPAQGPRADRRDARSTPGSRRWARAGASRWSCCRSTTASPRPASRC